MKRLAESEERYRTVIEHSNDGVVFVQNNTIVYANKRFVKLLGYDNANEIIGKSPLETVHPDDVETVRENIRRRQVRQITSVEYTFRAMKKDGMIIHIECSGTTMLYRGQVATVGFFRDITARFEALAALKESEEKYRSLVENMQDAVYRCNLDGEIVFASPAAAAVLGCESANAMIGMNIRDFYNDPGDGTIHMKALEASGSLKQYEIILRRRDNRQPVIISTNCQFYRDIDGNIRGVEGVYADITDRKKAENALKESERRYKNLLESVTDYIYTVELYNNRPFSTTHGPGCIAVTGYTPEEYTSDRDLWYRIIYPDDRQGMLALTHQLLSGREIPPVEHRIIHKSGEVRWVRSNFVLRFDDFGNLIAYDGLVADITERKKAEEALRESENKFRDLAEKAVVGIYIAQDRLFKYVNEACAR
ncbi:MAG TPA: PAS domain S-box protein, partial [Syntrophorhabdaceae bacterium]|nr:PAS domain S-box protein [Syntrophorhabdaceae bacterium]